MDDDELGGDPVDAAAAAPPVDGDDEFKTSPLTLFRVESGGRRRRCPPRRTTTGPLLLFVALAHSTQGLDAAHGIPLERSNGRHRWLRSRGFHRLLETRQQKRGIGASRCVRPVDVGRQGNRSDASTSFTNHGLLVVRGM